MPQPEESPEQGTIVTNLGPPETYPGHPEWDKVLDPGPPEVKSDPPEQDQVTQHPTVSGTYFIFKNLFVSLSLVVLSANINN